MGSPVLEEVCALLSVILATDWMPLLLHNEQREWNIFKMPEPICLIFANLDAIWSWAQLFNFFVIIRMGKVILGVWHVPMRVCNALGVVASQTRVKTSLLGCHCIIKKNFVRLESDWVLLCCLVTIWLELIAPVVTTHLSSSKFQNGNILIPTFPCCRASSSFPSKTT